MADGEGFGADHRAQVELPTILKCDGVHRAIPVQVDVADGIDQVVFIKNHQIVRIGEEISVPIVVDGPAPTRLSVPKAAVLCSCPKGRGGLTHGRRNKLEEGEQRQPKPKRQSARRSCRKNKAAGVFSLSARS